MPAENTLSRERKPVESLLAVDCPALLTVLCSEDANAVNVSRNGDEVARRQARLVELDSVLALLQGQYEVLTNAFKFDEARTLVTAIEAAEHERAALVAALPPGLVHKPAPFTVARRRRRR